MDMRYVFLLTQDRAYETTLFADNDESRAVYGGIGEWFSRYADRLEASHQLFGRETATTVRFAPDRTPIVTDGPFVETNEVVGGFTVVNVQSLDEALDMARAWPGGAVEIRPTVERGRPGA